MAGRSGRAFGRHVYRHAGRRAYRSAECASHSCQTDRLRQQNHYIADGHCVRQNSRLFISLAVFYPSFIRRNRRDKLKRKLQNKSERLSAETAICLELRQSLSDRRFDLSDRTGSSRLLHPLFNFNEKTAGNPTAATLILISALLTGFGIYDRLGQFAGAGSAVPVTGFANSMTSAALEHRSEGLVLGVATNMFKLAGNVIVFGVVAAYIVGLIRFACEKLFS